MMRVMAPALLSLIVMTACTNEGKLPFRDDALLAGAGGSGGDGGSGGADSWPSESCWSGTLDCNPLDNDGCESGHACDISESSLVCFDPPNTQGLGDYCDNGEGPYCAGGLRCEDSMCMKFCCDSSDCDGSECFPIDSSDGNLGVCAY